MLLSLFFMYKKAIVTMVKLNKEQSTLLFNRLKKADNEKILSIILKRTTSHIGLLELCSILENLKKEESFEINENIIYLIEKDLSEWELEQSTSEENITVTINGFKCIEEANEFCAWYSGQGEQDASIWFDCRKSEGVIDVSIMDAEIIRKTGKNNINMTLKLYK